MSRSQRMAMVDLEHPRLSVVKQCRLLKLGRSAVYYRPKPTRSEDLELMASMDRQYLKTPYYVSRRMTAWLRTQGHRVNRKRVQRLMRAVGLEAIYRKPNTSKPAPGHRIYPYLVKGVAVDRVDQVWAADITCLPMSRGFLYLVAIMGLAQPVRAVLEALQHPGGVLLRRRSQGGSGQRTAGALQHRPGKPVHR